MCYKVVVPFQSHRTDAFTEERIVRHLKRGTPVSFALCPIEHVHLPQTGLMCVCSTAPGDDDGASTPAPPSVVGRRSGHTPSHVLRAPKRDKQNGGL